MRMRILTNVFTSLILALFLSAEAIAYHDAPPPRTPTIPKGSLYLRGTMAEAFGAPATFSRSFGSQRFGEPPRYFEASQNPFTTILAPKRLSVSPATHAYRSLGPITSPNAGLKPKHSLNHFPTLYEKVEASSIPMPNLKKRMIP